ncbi:hypothetical protein JRO89_XS06G0229700 [Xanthoceras sorbifolium]|uniref:Uncharacterized protein n=1 Tax=Xanthoceras sorbifolium TaxID=99658 RepID=A0ABQ8HZ75_9ROSI|nr:hypothetical protein JRO89_XS06G0229700 [Xanthoceras sorbifolium]
MVILYTKNNKVVYQATQGIKQLSPILKTLFGGKKRLKTYGSVFAIHGETSKVNQYSQDWKRTMVIGDYDLCLQEDEVTTRVYNVEATPSVLQRVKQSQWQDEELRTLWNRLINEIQVGDQPEPQNSQSNHENLGDPKIQLLSNQLKALQVELRKNNEEIKMLRETVQHSWKHLSTAVHAASSIQQVAQLLLDKTRNKPQQLKVPNTDENETSPGKHSNKRKRESDSPSQNKKQNTQKAAVSYRSTINTTMYRTLLL